jgi:hypothetical protein
VAAERRLVLDANILMRAVLGHRVRQIIGTHFEHATFFAPDSRSPTRSSTCLRLSASAVATMRPWLRR